MDITNISKSKLRTKIIELYFSHPEKEYYIRQLARLLKKPAAYVRQELLNLEKNGLFVSELKGNQKYFRLNKEYHLYEEVKRIVFKTIGIEGNLKRIFKNIKDIRFVFLFGSYAEGRENSLSDIDIMIIGNPNEDELVGKISKLEGQLDREINYSIYSPDDFEKKIKQKEAFIKNILLKPRIFLIGNQNEFSRIYK